MVHFTIPYPVIKIIQAMMAIVNFSLSVCSCLLMLY